MHIPSRRVLAATAALTSALFLAGCADDDDPIASPSEPVNSPTPTQSAAASIEDFCDAKVAIDAAFLSGGPPEQEGDATPSPEQIGQGISKAFSDLYEDYERTAPEEVRDEVAKQVDLLDKAIKEGDQEFFFDPEFAAADKTVDDFLTKECDVKKISGTAADYEFTGLPTVSQEGLTALTLTNEGDEFHEMILMRINEGVEEDVEELLKMDEDEVEGKIQPVGVVLASPGTTATNFFDVPAGRYAVLCFISEGSDAEHDFQGDGPPHFTKGMLEELTVQPEGGATSSPTSSPTSSSSSSGSASTASEEDEDASASPTATSS